MTEAGPVLLRHGGSVPASGCRPDATSQRMILSDHAGVEHRWRRGDPALVRDERATQSFAEPPESPPVPGP